MRQRFLTIALALGCAVLAAAAFITITSQDRQAPVIQFEDEEKELIYKEGDDQESLLEDVTAKDNRDGDLTDQVFVDSITPVSDNKRVVIKYAVIDSSNNVAVKSRIAGYVAEEKETEAQEENPESEDEATSENSEMVR